MKPASLLKQVRDQGIEVKLSGENLEVSFAKEPADPIWIERVKENKATLIAYLRAINRDADADRIPLAPQLEHYPITPTQLRFWILCQIDEINQAYHLPIILELHGKVDEQLMNRAFQMLISRHEILRSYLVETQDGIIAQQVLSPEAFNFQLQKISLSDKQQVDQWIADFTTLPFFLKNAPLFKAVLLRQDAEHTFLCLNIHHIVFDGWSLEIFLRELGLIYDSLSVGTPAKLPDLKIQFKDYAVWANRLQDKSQERDYWLQRFEGDIPTINLPTYQPRPNLKTYAGAVHTHTISSTNLGRLRDFSNQQKGTLFTVLSAALNGLLFRYTGQTDIVLGTPFSGRNHPDLQHQIGLYINTLPVRLCFSEASNFLELWKKQKTALDEAFSHSSYSFGELVNELNLSRDTSRSPIFDLLVIHQQQDNTFLTINDAFSSLECRIYEDIAHTVSKYDITFTFLEKKDKLSLILEYNTDLFLPSFIEDLAVNFECFIKNALADPDKPICDIAFLSSIQEELLLRTFNSTDFPYARSKTVIDLFQQKVGEIPQSIALICEDRDISYADLDQRSAQLALYLRSFNPEPGACIGVCIGRSIEMVVAIFGIMKAGCAYLPLDPFFPIERLDYIIKHSGASLIVADQQTSSILPRYVKTVILEEDISADQTPAVSLPSVESNSRAYVIYTSGSTGKPKGVEVAHHNLFNFIIGMDNRFGKVSEKAVWLATTSVSFDISILELIWTLTRGDKVIIHLERPQTVHNRSNMDFSLFYFPTGASPQVNKYRLLLEGAVFADKHEFEAVWVPERHFHQFGDQFPNPSVAAAAISTITSSVKLRSGSIVLPLHDPVRVAEEWSMVDNLSKGRVEVSIASGWHPNDFVLAPDDYQDRRKKMQEGTKVLRDIWRGQTITRKNGVGKDFSFQVHPKPVQAELPVWITAAGSVGTFEYAGTIGANILTHLLGQSIEDLSEKIAAYKRARAAHGFDPEEGKIALMMHTFIGADEATVRQTVEKPFKEYLRNSLNLIKPIAEEQELDLNEQLDTVLDIGFTRFYKTSSLFGTPESCLEVVERVFKMQVTEIACLIDFGVEEQMVLDNLPRLQQLKDLIQRSKAQQEFVQERLKKLSVKEETAELILRHQVTHLQSTPSFFQEFLQDETASKTLQQMNNLLIGGEVLKDSLVQHLMQLTQADIYNMYGPTETTIWSCVQKVAADEPVNIGRPIANTKIFILDRFGHLCPIGVPGELCIGGSGVSIGYLNDPRKTADKFVYSPYLPHERIYKTGDLAYWLPSGNLYFLGRLDRQVKINGYRIELEEVENVLLEYEAVEQCVLTTHIVKEKVKLTAYLKIKDAGVNEERIRAFLRQRLPNYMIPQYLLRVNEFPLTPNGKVDVKQLPKPEAMQHAISERYQSPGTETEKQLAVIWEQFLQMDRVSIDANFFEVGGNSMKAFQLLNRINSEIGTDLKIIAFFQYPTIRLLAENLYDNKLTETVVDKEEVEMEDIDDLIEFMDDI